MAQENSQRAIEEVHTSGGSYWPIVLAAALTISLVGLVSNLLITLIGALLALGAAVAWTMQRFQEPPSTVRSLEERVHLPALDVGEAEVEAPVEIERSPSWWGLIWFITTEGLLFANLIAAYVYLRVSSETWPPVGMPYRELLFPIVSTVILLSSGVPAYYAHRAGKRGDRRGLQIGFILAALLGAVFLAGQGYEYTTLGFTPQTNVFAAGFFVLTGLHGIHVVMGLGLLLFVIVLSLLDKISPQRSIIVEVASTYWHFVDAVWIFLFALLYLLQ